ncbi:MAG: ureidoglycolate lyase [Planctomycetes bacterium]|nr:ureidoglycolate lyase [Planctomycetota bacterium]MCD7896916.1 ureidoglycolate lyase [Planctomycetaceae bacterium]
MRYITIEQLTPESFSPFGSYRDLLHPEGECIGGEPIEFFRDMVHLHIDNPTIAICRVVKRPLVIDTTEMHSRTPEATLSLDADTLIHVGPATPPGIVPLDRFRVFFIPKGTIVTVHAGVWHHAAFLYDTAMSAANVIGILPERTYANDSNVITLPEENRLAIRDM